MLWNSTKDDVSSNGPAVGQSIVLGTFSVVMIRKMDKVTATTVVNCSGQRHRAEQVERASPLIPSRDASRPLVSQNDVHMERRVIVEDMREMHSKTRCRRRGMIYQWRKSMVIDSMSQRRDVDAPQVFELASRLHDPTQFQDNFPCMKIRYEASRCPCQTWTEGPVRMCACQGTPVISTITQTVEVSKWTRSWSR